MLPSSIVRFTPRNNCHEKVVLTKPFQNPPCAGRRKPMILRRCGTGKWVFHKRVISEHSQGDPNRIALRQPESKGWTHNANQIVDQSWETS